MRHRGFLHAGGSPKLDRADWIVSMPAAEERRVRASVRAFVLSAINVMNLGDDDDLFESGLANSLFAIQLMTFIEKTFGIEVGIDDLDIDNFKSLNATTAFVMSKRVQLRSDAS